MKFALVATGIAGFLLLASCGGGPAPRPANVAPPAGSSIQLGAVPAKPGPAANGVVLGALLSADPGKSLSDADLAFMNQQTNRALESAPTNQASTWHNPEGGLQASVTATRTYQQPNGTYCREYTQTIAGKNGPQTARGAACRNSDGSWQAI